MNYIGLLITIRALAVQYLQLILLSMSCSIVLSVINTKQNTSFMSEFWLIGISMAKVNISTDFSVLYYYTIPTFLAILIVNSSAVKLFRTLDENFVHKMIIYDSINNILFGLFSSYGRNFSYPISIAPFCGFYSALNQALGCFNRFVPLVIVLYRYKYLLSKRRVNEK